MKEITLGEVLTFCVQNYNRFLTAKDPKEFLSVIFQELRLEKLDGFGIHYEFFKNRRLYYYTTGDPEEFLRS